MCGILTLLYREPQPDLETTLARMTRLVAHRGPDGEVWRLFELGADGPRPAPAGAPARLGMGHRRLSILDLSDRGLQPMARRAPGGHDWIVFNGEVYNYQELRAALEALGETFSTGTDTEVVLAAYARWGTGCFARFNGMWALALLDGARRRLVVSRDRLGIKPLYLRIADDSVAVVSELKQLTALPGAALKADAAAVVSYVQTGYEDAERTFFAGVRPVAAGTWAAVDLDHLTVGPFESFWHPEVVVQRPWKRREAAEALAGQLRRAVRWRLRSDVPVGCALSGGLDSSSVAAVVSALRREMPAGGEATETEAAAGLCGPLHSFTVSFPGERIDEGPFAGQVSEHLGTAAHVTSPTPESFLADLDAFVWAHDEPVGSLAMYGGYRMGSLTREAGVPVTLNGQGGDEVLGGYWQSYLAYLVGRARRGGIFGAAWHLLGSPFGGNPVLLGQLGRMAGRWRHRRSPPRLLRPMVAEAAEPAGRRVAEILRLEEAERRLHEIRVLHLPRLLRWDDRNLMAFSVEGRYPFLDHELIELCLSFPPGVLYRRGWTKLPLRDSVSVGELPRSIAWRRSKWGFVTPQARWLQGPLRPALEALVASEDSPLWEWVEPQAARRLAARAWHAGTRAEEPGQALFRLWMLDRWLRRFGLGGAAV